MLINNEKRQPTELDKIVDNNTIIFNTLKSGFERSFAILNFSQNPQNILDLLGNKAIDLFTMAQKTVEFLQFVDPSYSPPVSRYTYTFNEDGTVTWDKPEPVEPPTPPTPPEETTSTKSKK